jgi:hypothetical protein
MNSMPNSYLDMFELTDINNKFIIAKWTLEMSENLACFSVETILYDDKSFEKFQVLFYQFFRHKNMASARKILVPRSVVR